MSQPPRKNSSGFHAIGRLQLVKLETTRQLKRGEFTIEELRIRYPLEYSRLPDLVKTSGVRFIAYLDMINKVCVLDTTTEEVVFFHRGVWEVHSIGKGNK